jgi:hypothetical protein
MENINNLAREMCRELLDSDSIEIHIELCDDSQPNARVEITIARVCGCERCVEEREEDRAMRRAELGDFSEPPPIFPGSGEHWEP